VDFSLEACLIAVVIPVFKIFGPARLTLRRATDRPSGVFLVHFLGRTRAHIALHFAWAVGVVAALLYVALTFARPEPSYLVAHGLKVLEVLEVVSSRAGDDGETERQSNE
jgi:hypothetical protein